MRRFRLLVAIAAIVCLATVAYIKEHFAKSELISQLSLSERSPSSGSGSRQVGGMGMGP